MTDASTMDAGVGLTERMVRLPDGRRLRTVVAGEGAGPLVVFEAGMTAPAASWVHTQREVSAVARTVSYDRAGYATSDPDTEPRTLERLASDLTGLLDAIGETEPVVLVGHSWGGPVIRLFAAQQPDRVAGLVFVDSTLAEGVPERMARVAARMFRVMALLARLGATGLVERVALPQGAPGWDPGDLALLRRDALSAQALRTGAREAEHLAAALPTMRALQAAGTPPVPTTCVQAGLVERGMTTRRPLLNAAAEELMARLPQGKVVVVDESGHLIPQEAPGPVRDAILEVHAAAAR